MSLDDLLREGAVERVDANRKHAEDTLRLAQRDIKVAGDNLRDGNYDWVLAISYNAMLSAARALMTSQGYRPSGESKHVSVVRFIEETLGGGHENMVLTLDRLRKRRHKVVYDIPDTVSENEARQSLKTAEEFMKKIREKIQ